MFHHVAHVVTLLWIKPTVQIQFAQTKVIYFTPPLCRAKVLLTKHEVHP